eukprot:NODE_1861_length_481_cov_48.986111_g1783_i0.p4 GENE.NODE_1861_length_481_cov_48.986111_g1783_i0~~NODE_1861_length_481_cov_48.986111_g1783_i0.p4  ORF type:complete len:96 (+),score=19.61 NODE_1861_length_481_cov_48.986111_g1783_i0:81-368(+)
MASVFVGNVHFRTSWQDLKDHFRDQGFTPSFAEIYYDRDGWSKGCGVVGFEREEEVAQAIEKMDNSKIRGRPISVQQFETTLKGKAKKPMQSQSR